MPKVLCAVCEFACSSVHDEYGQRFPRCRVGVAIPRCRSGNKRSSLGADLESNGFGDASCADAGLAVAEGGPLMVLLYYSYVTIADVAEALRWQRILCEHLDLRGRVRVSPEGVNILLDGTVRSLRCYCDCVETYGGFGHGIDFKLSNAGPTQQRFPKLSCKPTAHVVEIGLQDTLARPEVGGKHVAPDEWHDILQGIGSSESHPKDVVLLDVRNVYESRIGRFECDHVETLAPDLRHFAQFPSFVDKNLDMFRGKRVMMYCTGGVRCERASSYLLSKQVATEVCQLRGGICRYLERFHKSGSFFHGKNFVFDHRRVEPWHDNTIVGRCDSCGDPWDEYDNGPEVHCRVCRVLMLVCSACRNTGVESSSLLCGGSQCDACCGEGDGLIRCSCGCSPQATAGPICRRTGYFTRRGASLPQALQQEAPALVLDCGAQHRAAAAGVAGRSVGCLPWCWDFMALFRVHARTQGALRISVRSASSPSDADACIKCVNEAFEKEYGAARYHNPAVVAEAAQAGRLLLACNEDGTVLGCLEHEALSAGAVPKFGPVAVAPQWQRRGVGTALAAEIEHRCILAGCSGLQVEIRRGGGGGRCRRLANFYMRRGYADLGGPRRRGYAALGKALPRALGNTAKPPMPETPDSDL